jgi:hypothetical protein
VRSGRQAIIYADFMSLGAFGNSEKTGNDSSPGQEDLKKASNRIAKRGNDRPSSLERTAMSGKPKQQAKNQNCQDGQ